MYEVEVKVPADHEAVRGRLEDRGAEFLGAVSQTDTYYDAPHRDFAETDEALRVRREVAQTDADDPAAGESERVSTFLTYKGPLVDAESKSRQEAETAIADPEALRTVLESLGFHPAATVEKERERYAYEGFTVTLDNVRGLGEFLEVERAAEAVDTAREGAFEVLRDLDLDPADQIRTSYLGLLIDDG